MKNWLLTPSKPTIYEIILLCLLSLIVFGDALVNAPFHPDESLYIANSEAFEQWLSWDTESKLWKTNNSTLGAPNVPKFLIAFSRIIAGYSVDELNEYYDFTLSLEENQAENRTPSSSLLYSSRFPMAILAGFVGIFLYTILCKTQNRLIALLWILFFLTSPLMKNLLVRAMTESLMITGSVLSVYFVYKGLTGSHKQDNDQPQTAKHKKTITYFLLGGFFLGLAVSSKIHSALMIGSFSVLILLPVFTQKKTLSFREKIIRIILPILIYSLTAFLTFVILHPVLYHDLFSNCIAMIRFRTNAMQNQLTPTNNLLVYPFWKRVQIILTRTQEDYFLIKFKLLTSGLALTGLYFYIQDWKKHLTLSFSAVLFGLFSVMIASAFFSPLLWMRYFIFPALAMMILSANGLGRIIQMLTSKIKTQLKEKRT